MVLVAVHVNAEVEALGTLTRQLGEIAVDRYSRPAFPTEVSVTLRKMEGVCLDAVAQADETRAAAGVGPADSVVANREHQAAVALLERDVDPRRVRMLGRVGERLGRFLRGRDDRSDT